MLTGENGILTQAKKAKEETEESQRQEENILSSYEDYLSQITNNGFIESKGVNAPVLGQNMELVTYNEQTGNWDTNNSTSSYEYIAGKGTEDNNSSKWANAVATIDGVESYFVWIPRYAYKINSVDKTIDVKFLKGTSNIAADGTICKDADDEKLNPDTDYIIHPAFTSNVDLGGWRNELTGIWIGKYESARLDATSESEGKSIKIKVQPGVVSFRNTTIGDMYTYAREYSSNLNSHMLKNSEWGAVAYLTHSKYGRNGNEVTINNSSKYITGSAGNSVSAEEDVGTTNDYTSNYGVLASSTGNVYGIYDLSGGAYEYVAAYYRGGTTLENGESFANRKEKNTEWSTIYEGQDIEKNYIIGDATKETRNLNNDSSWFVANVVPFFDRGGCYKNSANAGIFFFGREDGKSKELGGFRLCLII